ncbi:Urm1-domain-containing protein [Xylaria sp. FL0064]|nr:Urm1-domain-containing protein [Xylaria sp. FL0064]
MAAVTTTTTITETAVTDDIAKNADVPELSITVEFTYSHFSPNVPPSPSPIIANGNVNFISGGLEMLFSDQRRHVLSVPALDKSNKPVTVAYLIEYLCEHTMRDTRKELFVLDDHLRPGILVLINDADWELEGEEAYEIQNGDNILFVSTLHGG